jgi:hypothetical protein
MDNAEYEGYWSGTRTFVVENMDLEEGTEKGKNEEIHYGEYIYEVVDIKQEYINYWMEHDNLSREDAEKRLEELTKNSKDPTQPWN